jgi:HEAT repeat protein
MDYDAVVSDLAVPHRAKKALRLLMEAGRAGTPAVRRGLAHANPVIRAQCCNVLDHFLDEAALPELVATLHDANSHVRARALHALSCDRCKEGACRPDEAQVVPIATRLLAEDADRYVRTSAVQALAPFVHRRADVRQALIAAHESDPDPMVRKVAGWHCPGGPIFEGRRTKHGRLRPRPPALVQSPAIR